MNTWAERKALNLQSNRRRVRDAVRSVRYWRRMKNTLAVARCEAWLRNELAERHNARRFGYQQ